VRLNRALAGLLLLAIAGCASARMPVTNSLSAGRQPGEALVVMSLQVKPGSPLDQRGVQSIALLFQPYDKTMQHLHKELDLVTLFRLNGMIEFGQGGDLRAPLPTVYSLPPGDYVAVVSNVRFNSNWNTIYEAWFVPYDEDALIGNRPVSEADVRGLELIRFTVVAGQATYAGDIQMTDFTLREGSAKLVAPHFEIGRNDDASLAAVRKADATVSALTWLPARSIDP
jgi:hypothetical protein